VIATIVACRTELQIPYAVACRALAVSESWFYKHLDRPPTPAETRRAELDAAITEVFTAHDGEYGSPRVHAELIERPEFEHLSVNTVAERMQALELKAKKRPVRRSLTRPDPHAPKFANLLDRKFNPAGPNVAWCGDITEISTWEGKLYVATVIDLWSRRLIGYAIAEHCRASLVCDALRMAIAQRGGQVAGVIMHTDRGSQYTSRAFTELCARHHITQSMSRAGSCLDCEHDPPAWRVSATTLVGCQQVAA
jgi:transposase InsO family protein